MNQMSAKAGIKKHGKDAEAALVREFAQLENLDLFKRVNPMTHTKKQRKEALRAINLIREKHDGTLKGRTVADGRPQRPLYDRSQTASPTVSTDALVLSIMIDANKNRDSATADVAGAYLKAYMDDFVVMKFTGVSVDILCATKPSHAKHVVMEGGVKCLYVRLVKAHYGCVKSAFLLWYKPLSGTLNRMGFEQNPYDLCLAKCTIDGKQCTIAWYVYDMKISHVDPEVVVPVCRKCRVQWGSGTLTHVSVHSTLFYYQVSYYSGPSVQSAEYSMNWCNMHGVLKYQVIHALELVQQEGPDKAHSSRYAPLLYSFPRMPASETYVAISVAGTLDPIEPARRQVS
jgi:hypothetical protein